MNIEEYISSGILESYVLDELSDPERTEVEKLANEHDEIREELDRIEQSIEALAFETAIKPPQQVRATIMADIRSENTTEKEKELFYLGEETKSSLFMKYAAAASTVIAIGSVLLAINYWQKWKSAEDQLADLVTQNQQFAQNYNTVNQQLDELENTVAILNNSAFTRVVLKGTENAPNALATVYWNASTENVYLSIQNLKELSQDQQYQLWAIIDGKPVDAGVFSTQNPGLLVEMKNISKGAAAFAVTIEPEGGSATPSLETMQVLGNVS